MGLEAMELEFVKGVWLDEETAKAVRKKARERGITLTAHAPYWLNLNSKNRRVLEATKRRIVQAAAAAHAAGARYLTLHAAFYSGDDPRAAYRRIRSRLEGLSRRLAKLGIQISLAPELMGRRAQFGSFEELLKLCADVPGLSLCLDFAHNHARTGAFNSYAEYCAMLDQVRSSLGAGALKRMHIHITGIEYGPKGEIRHLNLRDSDMDYQALLAALKHKRAAGIVICESPNLEEDALMLKEAYSKL